jgi:hypothetical protein
MASYHVGLIASAALSLMGLMAGQSAAAGPREHVLTEELCERAVAVRKGDLVLPRLLLPLSYGWAPARGAEALLVPAPTTAQPNVGGERRSDSLYQVVAPPGSKVVVEWVYCYRGQLEGSAAQGRPADDPPTLLRPGRGTEPIRAGTVYRVTLNVGDPDAGAAGPREPVELTEEHCERAVAVRKGDLVLLKLPLSLPYDWALARGADALRALTNSRYPVIAPPGSRVVVEWVYCHLGRPELTPANAPPTLLRPGLRTEDIEPGTVYRVTLDVGAPAAAPAGPREPVVLLTEELCGRTVEVRKGDRVELRLPWSRPIGWAPVKKGKGADALDFRP